MTLQLDHFNKPSLYTYDSYARISELGAIFTLFLLFAYLATHLFEIPTEELKRDAVFMQQVAGIDKVSYWTINFAFDYGQFILAFTLYTLTFGLFDKSDIFIMGFDVLGKFYYILNFLTKKINFNILIFQIFWLLSSQDIPL